MVDPPPPSQRSAHVVLDAARELTTALAGRRFAAPVAAVYAPLEYAWCGFRAYVERYTPEQAHALFLGMNPGPFGMTQTGVPFGDVALVRDWLQIECAVRAPAHAHPRRPIEGFACRRREVSGSRLWGLFRDRFGDPAAFFGDARQLVVNYCPLMFLEQSRPQPHPGQVAGGGAHPPARAVRPPPAADRAATSPALAGRRRGIRHPGRPPGRRPGARWARRANSRATPPLPANPASQPGQPRRQPRLGGTGYHRPGRRRHLGVSVRTTAMTGSCGGTTSAG